MIVDGADRHGLAAGAASPERARAWLRATLAGARDGILVEDERGAVAAVNQPFLRLWGLPGEPPDYLDRPAGQLLLAWTRRAADPQEAASRIEGLRRVAGRRGVSTIALVDGRVVERSTVPVEGGGRAWLDCDLTLGLRAAREVGRAREQAISAARAKNDFLATMSHEMRTPLVGVLGAIELLRGTKLNGRQEELVGIAMDAARLVRELIDDLLDLTKLDAGRVVLEKRPFDAAELVRRTAATMRVAAEQKGVKVVDRIGSDVPFAVVGDERRVRQVLVNLLGNAVKFTDKGQVTAEVAVQDAGGEDVTLRFTVQDTGIGIAPEALERLFEPFEQADQSTTREYGGTGLGLAIVKRLVEQLGGAIEAESTLGEGSRFTVTATFNVADTAAAPPSPLVDEIPAAAATAAAMASGDEAALPLAPSTDAENGSVRILLAEDHAINRRIAVAQLAGLGVVVDEAANGQEAVDAVAHERYDLVFMDCRMPVMDGFEATRRIRTLEAGGRHTPIVALTASSLRGDAESCLAAGMDDYLAKPASADHLRSAIAAWVPGWAEEDDASDADAEDRDGDGDGRATPAAPAQERPAPGSGGTTQFGPTTPAARTVDLGVDADDDGLPVERQAAMNGVAVDMTRLAGYAVGLDANGRSALVSTELARIDELIRTLGKHSTEGEADRLRECASSLSDLAARLGATSLSAHARRMAALTDTAEAEPVLADLDHERLRVAVELRAWARR